MGQKKTFQDTSLKEDLEALVEPFSRGDPESPLRWVCKSTRRLSNELNQQGHVTSHCLIGRLLKELKYSLQANHKTIEGAKEHPDRDAQFRYIFKKTAQFQQQKQPVVSVDTKKKENVGNYKNPGPEYRKKGIPRKVDVYDFIGPLGKVAPYGVYDVTLNNGFVNVGISHDTAEFAVASLLRWWESMGMLSYSQAKKLFVTADGGGSNGYRVRLWKMELQKLANNLGKVIHVSHYPPGTSKWNKIEHRMFNAISENWRGIPLTDYETIVSLLNHTTTEAGLTIRAMLDERIYETGKNVSDEELASVKIYTYTFHGEWNYKISPQK